ncbi:hypothetical protein IKG60_02650 [Candidatus Saccharibacteria bacterium]|nr:hypothetical protein [Candidatus Saccharibacteria bacterium]
MRELNVPGYGEHIVETFRMIFRNFKLFGPLLLLAVMLELLVVGATNETVAVFTALIFLMIWLTGIFFVRQRKAGREITFRDGLYNAMAPLMSSLAVFAMMIAECLPICLVVIAYSAAVQTDFLTMPAYALLFWGVAGLMILLSGYLLSSSLIAFIAVSAPGLYPWKALTTATELMIGRRVRFVLRLIALFIVLVIIGAAVVLPLMSMRAPVWLMTGAIVIVGCSEAIFATVYLYLYYRYLLKA